MKKILMNIGIGTNITIGEKIKAAFYYDLLMWKTTIDLDGKVVLNKGQVCV